MRIYIVAYIVSLTCNVAICVRLSNYDNLTRQCITLSQIKCMCYILGVLYDSHKCGDLVSVRVISSRYKWGTTVKAVMLGDREKVQHPIPIRRADKIVCFSISQMQRPGP